ncbi:PREDICTED: uncharacterized protein LOC105456246 [Wasmannia auropunctata]|uniref:uncharacterized protein LOC105456246 n=1 Tax=Wasmannia auropunctata TaxID=64793 RepID=UPI0005EDD0F9|nr:PREDICTED: uncharacterized protein LOC105456246 [Wasmannia auropunctata]
MANRYEITFGDLQVDERYRRLQRSLKLAVLNQHRRNSRSSPHDGRASTVTAWPSISSINVDTLDSSSPPSLQVSTIRSEVLASSNNLRTILLQKKCHNTRQEAMTTSSVKQYRVQPDNHVDRLVMPPPSASTVYRAFREPQGRVRTSSNCENVASFPFDRPMQSSVTANTVSLKSAPGWIPTNTHTGKEYLNTFATSTIPVNNFQKIDRVFSKWRVTLNDQYELIIKGTLECGKIARSKPVIRRYSATCVESKYKHKYILQGNIVDERNGLPDYIRGKFYNGFPDDWENVYQIWRTYVNQGCPVTFRWPTPITDSDDDLKSELTDLTYTCVKNKKTVSATRSCNLNNSKTENLNNTSEKKEKFNHSTRSSIQNYEKKTSFIKHFVSNSERDVIPVVQTKNIRLLPDEDKQNVKSNINSPCSSTNQSIRKVDELYNYRDILQEDKLNTIINNLADKNCSPKYINKIIEMFDCLDYVVSYRTGSECDNDSVVFTSHETSKSETMSQQYLGYNDNPANTNELGNKLTKLKSYAIEHSTDLGSGSIRNDSDAVQLSNPTNIRQQRLAYDDNPANTNELGNKLTELKSYTIGHSTDLGYGSIRNDSDAVQLSNPANIRQQRLAYDDNPANTNELGNKLTELKSYTIGHSTDLGYGSIRNDSNAVQLSNSAEHDRNSDESESETYAGIPKISIERVLKTRETFRKIYKRKVRKKIHPDAQKHATELSYDADEIEPVYVTNPVVNTKKNTLSGESCISITEDEVETMNNAREHKTSQNMIFSSHREVQRNHFDVYGKDKNASATHVQNGKLFDASEAQRVNLNVFIKEQKIPHRIQENAPSQFVADVDYITNSDIDVVTVSSSARTGENMMAPRAKVDQDIVTISENDSNFSEKPCASPQVKKKFTEQTRGEVAVKKSKPTIISSMPVNLKLRISRARQLQDPQMIAKNKDKQDVNIRPALEETDKKKSTSKTSIATKKLAVSDSHSKTTVDNKREVCPIINNKNETDDIKPVNSTTNPTTKQPKSSKPEVEKNPKVLTAWVPKVVHYAKSKSQLGLAFQGKLFNDAGHVVHRKFTTDVVLKRLSATLIETANHELYELRGDLNDNKHIIPKELVQQFRNGCPARIEQFCLIWKTLQHGNIQEIQEEKSHDATMDSLNAPISSRGRRILPPLSYWTGERITLKDNNPVYSPGNSQKSLLLTLTDNSREKNTMKQKVNSKNTSKKQDINKQTPLPENKTPSTNMNQTIVIENSRSPKKSPNVKTASNARKADNSKKFRKSVGRKRQLVQKLMFSSSSNEEEQKASPRKRVRNSQTNKNANPESHYTMTLRNRQKVETASNRRKDPTKSRHYTNYYSPTKRSEKQKMTYTYYQGIPQSEDFLSENEVSSI